MLETSSTFVGFQVRYMLKVQGVSICSHLFRLLFVSLDTFAVDITIEYLKESWQKVC